MPAEKRVITSIRTHQSGPYGSLYPPTGGCRWVDEMLANSTRVGAWGLVTRVSHARMCARGHTYYKRDSSSQPPISSQRFKKDPAAQRFLDLAWKPEGSPHHLPASSRKKGVVNRNSFFEQKPSRPSGPAQGGGVGQSSTGWGAVTASGVTYRFFSWSGTFD